MNEQKIEIPKAVFDDREFTKKPSAKEVFAQGKELGRITIEGLGIYIFHIIGNSSIRGGLDLKMTDPDGIAMPLVSVTGSKETGYKMESSLARAKGLIPGHDAEITQIVDSYTTELAGFGVIRH